MKVSTEYLKTLPQHARNNVARRLRRRVGPIGIMLKEHILYNSPKISVVRGYEHAPSHTALNIPHKIVMRMSEYDWGYVQFIRENINLLIGRDYLCMFPHGLVMDEEVSHSKYCKYVTYRVKHNPSSDPVGSVFIIWENGKIVSVSGVMVGVYVLLHQVGYTGA